MVEQIEMREEEVLVLFGSQTGNSELAAEELSAQIPEKLSRSDLKVTARHMHLDDFLEIEKGKWTRLVVIVTSSYGAGQAPIGCHRFREFCDALLLPGETNQSRDGSMLASVSYALLGLGDSKYTTYFQNPTTIDTALKQVGATRVGDIGKADASGLGNDEQLKVIDRWIESIWPHLQKVLLQKQDPQSLTTAHTQTTELCTEIIPDYQAEEKPKNKDTFTTTMILPIAVALVASAYYYYLHNTTHTDSCCDHGQHMDL
jgi:sulfite reductase alpha subunit-like flavoprotein